MVNLDNPRVYERHDPGKMLVHLHDIPRQCQQAWKMAMDLNLPSSYSQVNKVVVLGMGGSAIGGDLARSLLLSEVRLPVLVHRDYDLPAFVDARTLVIASSYSGMTEETLTSFEQALKLKAKTMVVTTGGILKTIAEEKKVPVFHFTYPAPPRASLFYSFMPILGFLQKLHFVRDMSTEVTETVKILRQQAKHIDKGVAIGDNPAKQLAQKLFGHLPVIYGAGFLSEVARRWKTQINENSKAWAFHEIFPELNHNAVVGYEFPSELAERIVVVMLRSPLLNRRVKLRYDVTDQLLKKAKVENHFVDSEGKSQLSQMISLVQLGDYVSYYLAILYGADPSPVQVIDFLKDQLAKNK